MNTKQNAKMMFLVSSAEDQQRQYATLQAVLRYLLGVGPIPSARRGLGGSGRLTGTSGTVAN